MQQEVPQSDDDVQVIEAEGYDSAGHFTRNYVHWWPLTDAAAEEGLRWRVSPRGQRIADNDEDAALHPYMGKEYRSIATEGDGACAIHSLFGAPDACKGDKLFELNARQRAINTMGSNALQFQGRLGCEELFASVTSCLWDEYLLPLLYRENAIETPLQIFTQGEMIWHYRHITQTHASTNSYGLL